ncbi:MAG: lipopolysaccharide transport periplasmic protein LptA [Mariprofundaceae bacterium]|nr:lipopolysaccharide transport periplasmic protein LptA [Mariprofundaceae bacterium]
MIRRLWVISLVLFGASPVDAGPLRITSESLTVEHAENRAQFSGAVHLTRDDFELRCDRLVAFYKQQAGGELEQAEAYGNVSMRQGEKHGSSNEAIYKESEGILILIGKAKVEGPEGTIQSEKIVHNINTTETSIQQGAAGERVRLTFEAEGDKGENGQGSAPAGKPLP